MSGDICKDGVYPSCTWGGSIKHPERAVSTDAFLLAKGKLVDSAIVILDNPTYPA